SRPRIFCTWVGVKPPRLPISRPLFQTCRLLGLFFFSATDFPPVPVHPTGAPKARGARTGKWLDTIGSRCVDAVSASRSTCLPDCGESGQLWHVTRCARRHSPPQDRLYTVTNARYSSATWRVRVILRNPRIQYFSSAL